MKTRHSHSSSFSKSDLPCQTGAAIDQTMFCQSLTNRAQDVSNHSRLSTNGGLVWAHTHLIDVRVVRKDSFLNHLIHLIQSLNGVCFDATFHQGFQNSTSTFANSIGPGGLHRDVVKQRSNLITNFLKFPAHKFSPLIGYQNSGSTKNWKSSFTKPLCNGSQALVFKGFCHLKPGSPINAVNDIETLAINVKHLNHINVHLI